jgi:hypothetical protein
LTSVVRPRVLKVSVDVDGLGTAIADQMQFKPLRVVDDLARGLL